VNTTLPLVALWQVAVPLATAGGTSELDVHGAASAAEAGTLRLAESMTRSRGISDRQLSRRKTKRFMKAEVAYLNSIRPAVQYQAAKLNI